MVRRSLVPAHKFLEGDAVTIRCAHGDTVLYPLTEIEMAVSGLPVKVEAAVSDTLLVGVLLGTDAPELSTLLGAEVNKPEEQGAAMVVVTRAQAKKKLEEEILRRERSSLGRVQPHWRIRVHQRRMSRTHLTTRHPRMVRRLGQRRKDG